MDDTEIGILCVFRFFTVFASGGGGPWISLKQSSLVFIEYWIGTASREAPGPID